MPILLVCHAYHACSMFPCLLWFDVVCWSSLDCLWSCFPCFPFRAVLIIPYCWLHVLLFVYVALFVCLHLLPSLAIVVSLFITFLPNYTFSFLNNRHGRPFAVWPFDLGSESQGGHFVARPINSLGSRKPTLDFPAFQSAPRLF